MCAIVTIFAPRQAVRSGRNGIPSRRQGENSASRLALPPGSASGGAGEQIPLKHHRIACGAVRSNERSGYPDRRRAEHGIDDRLITVGSLLRHGLDRGILDFQFKKHSGSIRQGETDAFQNDFGLGCSRRQSCQHRPVSSAVQWHHAFQATELESARILKRP